MGRTSGCLVEQSLQCDHGPFTGSGTQCKARFCIQGDLQGAKINPERPEYKLTYCKICLKWNRSPLMGWAELLCWPKEILKARIIWLTRTGICISTFRVHSLVPSLDDKGFTKWRSNFSPRELRSSLVLTRESNIRRIKNMIGWIKVNNKWLREHFNKKWQGLKRKTNPLTRSQKC